MSNPLRTTYKVEPFENLCFLIRRCSGLVSQLTDKALEPESISFTQMLILLTLDVDQPVSITQISGHIGHDGGALTRVLDALERAQLVRRERNRHDRRTVRVDITDQGRHQLERALLLVGNLLNQISAPFSRGEHEMLITLLRRLVQGL